MRSGKPAEGAARFPDLITDTTRALLVVSGRKVVCIDEKLNMYEEDAGGVTLAYMKGGVPTLKILQQSSNDELGPELRAWYERCRKITWLFSIII